VFAGHKADCSKFADRVCVCPHASSRVTISETEGDGGLFPIGSLKESVQGESNGHYTDDAIVVTS